MTHSIRSMPSLWPAPNSSAHRSAVNWTLVSTLYEDRGYSGSHLRRHGYQSLLADIKRGLIDVAVVHRFDRLTRNLSDFQQIVAEFNAHNVALVSVIQQLDMSHHVGRLAASKNGV